MTNAPTNARPEPGARADSADVTPIDTAARGPLLLLLGSGLVWLILSGMFSLISSIQLHTPHFGAAYSFLTYGRVDAMRETSFVYGWAANAGLAIAIWVLGRLGGNLLRASNWMFVGAAFWNTAVAAGMIGIAIGDMTSFSLFQLPRYVQPILVVAYAAIAVSGVLAWMGRRAQRTFAAQWYAVAALFLFPWLSSITQLVLLWAPSRGVAQAVAAGWYAQAAWALWLAPLALAGVYYVLPKISGRALHNYESASVGFWALLFIGAWTGGRHLIGGPVPVWIGTMAVVASVLLLVHYIIVVLNLRDVIWGVRGTAPFFIRVGLIAYVMSGGFDALTAFRSIAVETQFTFFNVAVQQLALYGGLTMMFVGVIYYMVPRLTGNAWTSAVLTVGHRNLVTLGVVALVVTLMIAGWLQGAALLNPKVTFAEIFEQAKLPLFIASGAQLILVFANVLFLVNFLQTIGASVVSDVTALNPIRETSEASA